MGTTDAAQKLEDIRPYLEQYELLGWEFSKGLALPQEGGEWYCISTDRYPVFEAVVWLRDGGCWHLSLREGTAVSTDYEDYRMDTILDEMDQWIRAKLKKS